MIVPEKGHLLAQRRPCGQDLPEPPPLRLQAHLVPLALGRFGRLAPDLRRFLRGKPLGLFAGGADDFAVLVVDLRGDLRLRPLRRRNGIDGLGGIEQGIDGLDAPERVERLDLAGTAAETGAVQEMRGFKNRPGVVGLREHE